MAREHIINALVLGPESSGKSTSINHYFGERIEGPVESTHGASYKVKRFVRAKVPCKMSLWEVGGNRSFDLFIRHYIRHSKIIYVMLDLSDANANAKAELTNRFKPSCLKTHGAADDAVFVLIGNKANSSRVIPSAEFSNWVELFGFSAAFEIDSLDPNRMAELQQAFDGGVDLYHEGNREFKDEQVNLTKQYETLYASLQKYHKGRKANTQNYYSFFSKIFGGVDRAQKLAAAQALLDALESSQDINAAEHAVALRQGVLNNLYKQYLAFRQLSPAVGLTKPGAESIEPNFVPVLKVG